MFYRQLLAASGIFRVEAVRRTLSRLLGTGRWS